MTLPRKVVEPKKRGRPKIGEKRDKPWIKLKISRATFYRRQKERLEAKS